MKLTLHSKLELAHAIPENENFYFSTKCELSSLDPNATTFSTLLWKIYHDLEFNPPEDLRGQAWCFKINHVLYWANPGKYKQVIVGSTTYNQIYPLTKLRGLYRVHFFGTHTWIGETGHERAYPSNPNFRLRHRKTGRQ